MSERSRSRALDRDLELATAAHTRLLIDLDALVAAEALDISGPSRLPEWTIGHVTTHVTNSGDGHALMLTGAADGIVAHQYPDGLAGRQADIEAGAARPPAQQVATLRASCAALEMLWARSDWEGSGIVANGSTVPIADLPFLRIREVAIHHIDLGIGYEFADLPDVYVRLELQRLEMMLLARRPMGMTTLPAAALALLPTDRLAWFMGRSVVDGLAPASVF